MQPSIIESVEFHVETVHYTNDEMERERERGGGTRVGGVICRRNVEKARRDLAKTLGPFVMGSTNQLFA